MTKKYLHNISIKQSFFRGVAESLGPGLCPLPDFARIQKGTEAEIYPCWAPQTYGPSVAPDSASFSICVFYEMGSPLLAEGGSC